MGTMNAHVICDDCNDTSGEDPGFDVEEAVRDALENGWVEDDGKHYCPDCKQEERNG